jgi:acyl-CoA dehydrogenase
LGLIKFEQSRTTGPDTTQLQTRAKRNGDRYVINGQEVWTSRALIPILCCSWRTTPRYRVVKRTDGISVFLVDLREARGNGIDIRHKGADRP